jgi:hypothetical protein
MRGSQNAYCSASFLDRIIKGKKKDISMSKAYNILNKLSDIYVNLTLDELKALINSDEIYKRLAKRENRSFKARKDWISCFSPLNSCDDIILIEENELANYRQIRNDFGRLIIADNPNDIKKFDVYSKPHNFNLVPLSDRLDDPTIYYHNSWEQFFDEFNLNPINSLIITDNYMFSGKIEEQKEYSLYPMLRTIVPRDLCCDFHLTIFSCNLPNSNGLAPLNKDKAEKIIEEIKALNLCTSIKVTIVAHTIKSTTHDRELVTNYHYMQSGRGFGVVDKKGVKDIARGQLQHVFCGVDSYVTTKQLQAETVEWLKPIFEGVKGGNSQYSFIVGDKINRLFD